MRIAFGELAQETDSFSPLVTGLDDFETYGLFHGPEMLTQLPGVGPLGGFLEVAESQPQQLELIPLLRAWASAGGVIDQSTFETLADELLDRLTQALPVDAVFLSLHGAASAQGEDDVEGAVLSRVRAAVGAELPVVVSLDHHANITRRMVEHADLLVGHETQPHDTLATGKKTARILFRMLAGEVRPTIAWRKIPMLTPQDQFLTSAGPMQEWFDSARRYEQKPEILDVSPYPMQPWLDVAEGGWSVVVHTNADAQLAEETASDMAVRAWSNRGRFWASDRVAPEIAVRQVLEADAGLIILSDTGDSVYGGAPGDSTCLLRELLSQGPPPAETAVLVPLVDPGGVAAAMQVGAGQQIELTVGGAFDTRFSQPVPVQGWVESCSPGHVADLGERGSCELGPTALISCGGLKLVLLEQRSFAINHPVLYQHHGVDVARARAVVVKTASNFQFFADWRRSLIRVDSPGTTQSNLQAFDWLRQPRPVYPLDALPEWSP